MSTLATDSLKEELMTSNPEFRELVREHRRCEARISELLALQFPNQDELNEESFLKKKKLGLKDRMEEILRIARKSGGH